MAPPQVSEQEKIMNSLAENEAHIGRLYEAYAKKFPEHAEFWNHLAKEEMDHASAIRSLFSHSKVEEGIMFDPKRFNLEAIQRYIKYVTKCQFDLDQTNQQLKDVLVISLDLEKSLLESKFFEVFGTDLPRFKKTLNYLRISTESHIKEIEALMIKLGFLSPESS